MSEFPTGIPLNTMSAFVSISYSFYYYFFIVQLEMGNGETSRSSVIVQDCFSYRGFFVFPYEAEDLDF